MGGRLANRRYIAKKGSGGNYNMFDRVFDGRKDTLLSKWLCQKVEFVVAGNAQYATTELRTPRGQQ